MSHSPQPMKRPSTRVAKRPSLKKKPSSRTAGVVDEGKRKSLGKERAQHRRFGYATSSDWLKSSQL